MDRVKYRGYALRFGCLLLTLLAGHTLDAQHVYMVYLKDKQGSKYSLQKPSEFLSERALVRRNKQGIALDASDLPVSEQYLQAIKQNITTVHGCSKWMNAVAVQCTPTELARLDSLPFVLRTQELKTELEAFDYASRFTAVDNWGQFFDADVYGSASEQNKLIQVDYLHNKGYRGQDMHIAIFDGGFFKVDTLESFRAVRQHKRIHDVYDFVDRDSQLFDQGYHGMQVMSTMAAGLQARFVGTSPDAHFYLYRTEDGDSETPLEEFNWIQAAERADSAGVDLINSSLGYNAFDNKDMNYTHQMLDGKTALCSRGASMAVQKGILVVVSAGNSGNDAWRRITPPADAIDVLAVGATNAQGKIVSFSSQGPSADGRIKPDVAAMGRNVKVQHEKGGLKGSSGTSFAAPILCGAAACLWQAYPEFTNIEVAQALRISSAQYFNPDNEAGNGLANLERASDFLEQQRKSTGLTVFPRSFVQKTVLKLKDACAYEDITHVSLKKMMAKDKDYSYAYVLMQQADGEIWIESTFLELGVYSLRVQTKAGSYTSYFSVVPERQERNEQQAFRTETW